MTEDPLELVGWGGFKGSPDGHGVVELGYEISEARAGRGLATAAARAMAEEAGSQGPLGGLAAGTGGGLRCRPAQRAGRAQSRA